MLLDVSITILSSQKGARNDDGSIVYVIAMTACVQCCCMGDASCTVSHSFDDFLKQKDVLFYYCLHIILKLPAHNT